MTAEQTIAKLSRALTLTALQARSGNVAASLHEATPYETEHGTVYLFNCGDLENPNYPVKNVIQVFGGAPNYQFYGTIYEDGPCSKYQNIGCGMGEKFHDTLEGAMLHIIQEIPQIEARNAKYRAENP